MNTLLCLNKSEVVFAIFVIFYTSADRNLAVFKRAQSKSGSEKPSVISISSNRYISHRNRMCCVLKNDFAISGGEMCERSIFESERYLFHPTLSECRLFDI